MSALRRLCGSHSTHAGWSLGTLVAVVTILSLLGLLPWSTRAEVTEVKGDIVSRLNSIEAKVDALDRFETKIDKIDRIKAKVDKLDRIESKIDDLVSQRNTPPRRPDRVRGLGVTPRQSP